MGWISFFTVIGLVCAAAGTGLVELHWNRLPQPGPLLARWLRQLSDMLDKPVTVPSRASDTPPDVQPPKAATEQAGAVTRGNPVLIAGSHQGWYRVLQADELLQSIRGNDLLARISKVSRLAPAVFERDLKPMLLNYAEFVQLMPASESHHHANAGGLLAHTLETLLYAMTFRNGYLLPRGAGAEIIDAERDFWTYAVFVGALLHDVGKPVSDLRVQLKRSGMSDSIAWVPLGGSLLECGAVEYHIGFAQKAQRDYGAHTKLGVTLLQKLAPKTTLAFLSRAPSVLQELNQYLSGDGKAGAISEIVKRADQESTKRNLAHGPRARLESATSVPLVEQLMSAIRGMLKQGTHLPINRDGSAGWVFDDSVWFVAKRLADGVRDFIKKNAEDGSDGVPGEAKNDRLFDTWQEYGCILPNPQTGQAIWYVNVLGHDSKGDVVYKHRLSVLRFPLSKIWDSSEQFPSQMLGVIEILQKGDAGAPADANTDDLLPAVDETREPHGQQAAAPSIASRAAPPVTVGTTASSENDPDSARPRPEPRKIPVPKFVQSGGASRKSMREAADLDDVLDEADSARSEARAARIERDLNHAAKQPRHKGDGDAQLAARAAPIGGSLPAKASRDAPPDEGKAATAVIAKPGTKPAGPTRQPLAQGAAGAGDPAAVPRPVVLPCAAPPVSNAKEPSLLAIRFMQWLQAGLADGEIKHNEVGAPVHFVEQGMALVSPLIFREYAGLFGESVTGDQVPPAGDDAPPSNRLGLIVQKEVIRAGWHTAAPGGLNVWAFQVKRKGGKPSRLSAVVLREPSRWVMPVPPANPFITYAQPETSGQGGSPTA